MSRSFAVEEGPTGPLKAVRDAKKGELEGICLEPAHHRCE